MKYFPPPDQDQREPNGRDPGEPRRAADRTIKVATIAAPVGRAHEGLRRQRKLIEKKCAERNEGEQHVAGRSPRYRPSRGTEPPHWPRPPATRGAESLGRSGRVRKLIGAWARGPITEPSNSNLPQRLLPARPVRPFHRRSHSHRHRNSQNRRAGFLQQGRQTNLKAGTRFLAGWLELQKPAVGLDEALAQRQAKAGAGELCRQKRIEHFRSQVFRDARAVVADLHHDPPPFDLCPHRDSPIAGLLGGLHLIVAQLRLHLAH